MKAKKLYNDRYYKSQEANIEVAKRKEYTKLRTLINVESTVWSEY